MGVERKNPKLNWIGSFGLIILAGSLYRLKGVNSKIMKTEISEIMKKMGESIIGKK